MNAVTYVLMQVPAFDSSQCASAFTTACNEAITDDCGNDCGDVGTYCEGGEILYTCWMFLCMNIRMVSVHSQIAIQ